MLMNHQFAHSITTEATLGRREELDDDQQMPKG
jgi:hypothetical protein